jgi:hypothetical protein
MMCTRSKRLGADGIMRVGLFAIIGGAVSLRLAHWLSVPSDAADGVSGFFYGIAITSLLWSLRQRRAH